MILNSPSVYMGLVITAADTVRRQILCWDNRWFENGVAASKKFVHLWSNLTNTRETFKQVTQLLGILDSHSSLLNMHITVAESVLVHRWTKSFECVIFFIFLKNIFLLLFILLCTFGSLSTSLTVIRSVSVPQRQDAVAWKRHYLIMGSGEVWALIYLHSCQIKQSVKEFHDGNNKV